MDFRYVWLQKNSLLVFDEISSYRSKVALGAPNGVLRFERVWNEGQQEAHALGPSAYATQLLQSITLSLLDKKCVSRSDLSLPMLSAVRRALPALEQDEPLESQRSGIRFGLLASAVCMNFSASRPGSIVS